MLENLIFHLTSCTVWIFLITLTVQEFRFQGHIKDTIRLPFNVGIFCFYSQCLTLLEIFRYLVGFGSYDSRSFKVNVSTPLFWVFDLKYFWFFNGKNRSVSFKVTSVWNRKFPIRHCFVRKIRNFLRKNSFYDFKTYEYYSFFKKFR